MTGKYRDVFPGGNTSIGFYSFYKYIINPKEAKKIICIKGGPGTGKSSLMKKIGEIFLDKGYSIEYHHCSSDNNSLDGVVIKELKIAILDGTSPHVVDPKNPGAVDEILNMGEFWNEDGLKKYREDIVFTTEKISSKFEKAYKYFGAAKLIHDNLSSFNQNSLDKSKLYHVAEEIKEKIFKTPVGNLGFERHLFSTALTPNGIVSFTDSLTKEANNVYVLNGGPGTGKTTIMKYLSLEALKRGHYIEVFHDPFIPERIELLLIPDIQTAIVSSNEINNKKFNGIQIYLENLLDYNLIKSEEALAIHKKTFSSLLDIGLTFISEAKTLHDELEKYYIENMDFKLVEEKSQKLITRLNKYAL